MPSTFKPYRNELRRVFVMYALTPVIVLAGVVYTAIFICGYVIIEGRTSDNAHEVATKLGAELTAYLKPMEQLAADPDLAAVMSETSLNSSGEADVSRRSVMYEKLYAVVKDRRIKSRFQVFDAQGRPVMSDTQFENDPLRDQAHKTRSGKRYFELTAPGVNKGSALARLQSLLDPAPTCVVAMGDYRNDLEMLLEADIGAAPGNALAEVKAAASIVTVDHTQSAVADLIRQLERRFC